MTARQRIGGHALEYRHMCDVMPVFVDDGFVPLFPQWDEGIDFVLYRERDDLLIKVQQKGRWTIDRKYLDRDMVILFRHRPRDAVEVASDLSIREGKHWFMVPHDRLVDEAERAGHLATRSWQGELSPPPCPRAKIDSAGEPLRGSYFGDRMGPSMEAALAQFNLMVEGNRESIYAACAHGGPARPDGTRP